MSRGRGVAALLDSLQQLAEAAADYASHHQRMGQARKLYEVAVTTRSERAAFLEGLAARAASCAPEARRRFLVAAAEILRDQARFDDACVDVLTRTKDS